jgi:hypothetical protein
MESEPSHPATPQPTPSPPQPSSHRRKRRRWIFGAIALLILSAIAYVLVTNYRGRAALRKALDAMRANGMETGIADLQSKAPAAGSEENGASYYQAAFLLVSGFGPDVQLSTELCEPVGTDIRDRLKAFLDQQQDAYRLLQEGRRRKPGRYDIPLDDPSTPPMLFLASVVRGAYMLTSKCLSHQAANEPAEAIECLETLSDVTGSLVSMPGMFPSLVRFKIDGMLVYSIELAMSHIVSDTAPIERLQNKLRIVAGESGLQSCIKTEAALLAEMAKNPLWAMACQVLATEREYRSCSTSNLKFLPPLSKARRSLLWERL